MTANNPINPDPNSQKAAGNGAAAGAGTGPAPTGETVAARRSGGQGDTRVVRVARTARGSAVDAARGRHDSARARRRDA